MERVGEWAGGRGKTISRPATPVIIRPSMNLFEIFCRTYTNLYKHLNFGPFKFTEKRYKIPIIIFMAIFLSQFFHF